MTDFTPKDAAAALRNGWTGETKGPIQTVELLVSNGGYFEVPHLLMTYVEYLAGLHSGKGPAVQYTDVRKFFSTYFPAPYRDAGAWLIFQYRHGLVHSFAPKVIRLDNDVDVGWHCDLGEEGDDQHLCVLPRCDGQNFNLRVYGRRLLDDFKKAARTFADDVENGEETFKHYRDGKKAYQEPILLRQIDKPYVCPHDKDWLRNKVQGG